MKILVVDGQGGNIGRQIVRMIAERFTDVEILAVGTNSIATSNMIKAGASSAATGENAVVVASRKADIIVGPVGIVIADALLGEVTPNMAKAVGQSDAARVLIPMNKCDTVIAGVSSVSTAALLEDAIAKISEFIRKKSAHGDSDGACPAPEISRV